MMGSQVPLRTSSLMLNNADIKFGTVTGEDGQPVEVTHGSRDQT